jgi:hypothetical protein
METALQPVIAATYSSLFSFPSGFHLCQPSFFLKWMIFFIHELMSYLFFQHMMGNYRKVSAAILLLSPSNEVKMSEFVETVNTKIW